MYKGYYCTNSLSIKWPLRKNTSLRLRDIGDVDTRITIPERSDQNEFFAVYFFLRGVQRKCLDWTHRLAPLGRKRTRLRKRSAPGSVTPYTSPCSSDKWRSYENLDNRLAGRRGDFIQRGLDSAVYCTCVFEKLCGCSGPSGVAKL